MLPLSSEPLVLVCDDNAKPGEDATDEDRAEASGGQLGLPLLLPVTARAVGLCTRSATVCANAPDNSCLRASAPVPATGYPRQVSSSPPAARDTRTGATTGDKRPGARATLLAAPPLPLESGVLAKATADAPSGRSMRNGVADSEAWANSGPRPPPAVLQAPEADVAGPMDIAGPAAPTGSVGAPAS